MKTAPIEPLETRIAPATLISPTTVVFHDLDGDDVTVRFSQPIFAGAGGLATANLVLKFDTGTIDGDAANDAPQQLQLIDLSGQAAATSGVSISVTAQRSATRGGDGFADVGFINATGVDLGAVGIAGDLGRIVAGVADATLVPAVKSLTVQSMGELGTSTQAGGGTLVSTFAGPLPSFIVKGHLRDADLSTTGSAAFAGIGAVSIGGSIFGGKIVAAGDFTKIKVAGSLLGGATMNSGRISSGGVLGSVAIGGSVVGTGVGTGVIAAAQKVSSVTIGGDLRGGTGANSGRIDSDNADIESVAIGGSIVGDAGSAGGIFAAGAIRKVTVGGDLRGGASSSAGIILAGDGIGSVAIKGSLFGNLGDDSGSIEAGDGIGAVTIGGSVRGGRGNNSAAILGDDELTSITIAGSLVGYAGAVGQAGENGEGSALLRGGFIGAVKIGGSVLGGIGDDSGAIRGSFDGLGTVTVAGSLLGGGGDNSGGIFGDSIGSIRIAGDVRGGAGDDSASLSTQGGNQIGSVFIGGSVFTGAGVRSALIGGYTGLPSVTIVGSLVGTAAVKAVISSNYDYGDQTHDLPTLGKISIGGRVEYAEILAGYSGTVGISADARIGSIAVGGDWIASSIAAGVARGADGNFGTADDALISPGVNSPPPFTSAIGSVVIKGQALGTPATISATDSFGIVSESIGSIKIGAVAEVLTAGVNAVALGATSDFIAREDVLAGQNAALAVFSGGNVITRNAAGTIFTWTDVDGDLVTLTTTKALLTLADFIRVDAGAGIQVQEIQLSAHAAAANNGVGVTLTATPQIVPLSSTTVGDGSVNLGYLNATGLDLGAVKIAGDLGRIAAGDATLTTASLASLAVQSMGVFGLSTQAAGATLHSPLKGAVGTITVRADVLDASVDIVGTPGLNENGNLKSLTLGGSLRAGADSAADSEGLISASGKIGSITIGRDVVGGIDADSARVFAGKAIGAVKIGGTIYGGSDANAEGSGAIVSGESIGAASIGGSIIGGGGDESGVIDGSLKLGAVTVKGALLGGGGEESGALLAESFGGAIASVKIGGDVRGGSGPESAYIHAQQTLGAVTIGGSFVGGSGQTSALIYAGSAIVGPHVMTSVSIGGDVIGGSNLNSASIGAANNSAGSNSDLTIGSVVIKGGLYGGTTFGSGQITANNIPKLTIGGSLVGGGEGSAFILATGKVGTATIGGSVEGSANATSAVLNVGSVGSLIVKGDLRGGNAANSGYLYVPGIGVKSITIGRSIFGGVGKFAGGIDVNGALVSLSIGGSVFGTAANPVQILAKGPLEASVASFALGKLALGKLALKGSANFLEVLGGYGVDNTPALSAIAQVGAISVGGSWTAGAIVSGVNRGADGKFATADDTAAQLNTAAGKHSKIASIVIKGRALGTVGGTDAFGFSSQEIGAVTVGAVKFKLLAGAGNDSASVSPAATPLLSVSSTGDFFIHEVA